jgi:hypothetical protein
LRRQQQQAQQQQQQQGEQEQAMRLSADPSGGLKGLMQLDMKGLYTAVHVAKSLAQLDNFRWGLAAPVVPLLDSAPDLHTSVCLVVWFHASLDPV